MVRPSRLRQPPRLDPVANGLAGTPGLGEMMGDNLRLGLGQRREAFDEPCSDARMQRLPPAPEHGGVGGVLHQRVLERVGRVRSRSAPGNEAGTGQPLERRVEVDRGHGGHRGDQLVGELPSDCGADLRHVLDRGEAIEARHQRSLQRRWNGEFRQRPVERIALVGLAEDAALDQRAGQFLDEQRHAICAREDLIDDRVGQRLVPGDAGNDAGAVATAEAVQGQHRHMRLTDPVRPKLRPPRDHQQHRQAGGTGNHSFEQIL